MLRDSASWLTVDAIFTPHLHQARTKRRHTNARARTHTEVRGWGGSQWVGWMSVPCERAVVAVDRGGWWACAPGSLLPLHPTLPYSMGLPNRVDGLDSPRTVLCAGKLTFGDGASTRTRSHDTHEQWPPNRHEEPGCRTPAPLMEVPWTRQYPRILDAW